MRVSKFRRPLKPILSKIQHRELDQLPFFPHTWTRPVGEAPYLHVVRCDESDPIIVGSMVGETTRSNISIAEWAKQETESLTRITRQPIVEERRSPFLFLWSVKEWRMVSGSKATDYVVLGRGCLVDREQSSMCAFSFWRVIDMRSLEGTSNNSAAD
jgi:hypothetical protein